MANKNNKSSASSKSRNGDRNNGKAWGKNHDAKPKVLTNEQEERRAVKLARREQNRTAPMKTGPSYTMPKITWDWATETVAGRHHQTRRYRIVGMCMAHERGREYVESTETKEEAKTSRKRR